jgi:hypothetical protein
MEFLVVFSWEKSNYYRVDSALGRCTDGIVGSRSAGAYMAGLGLGWRGVDGLRLECKQYTYINTERTFAHEERKENPRSLSCFSSEVKCFDPFSCHVNSRHVLRTVCLVLQVQKMQTSQTPKFIANFEIELSVASSLTLPPDSLPPTHLDSTTSRPYLHLLTYARYIV